MRLLAGSGELHDRGGVRVGPDAHRDRGRSASPLLDPRRGSRSTAPDDGALRLVPVERVGRVAGLPLHRVVEPRARQQRCVLRMSAEDIQRRTGASSAGRKPEHGLDTAVVLDRHDVAYDGAGTYEHPSLAPTRGQRVAAGVLVKRLTMVPTDARPRDSSLPARAPSTLQAWAERRPVRRRATAAPRDAKPMEISEVDPFGRPLASRGRGVSPAGIACALDQSSRDPRMSCSTLETARTALRRWKGPGRETRMPSPPSTRRAASSCAGGRERARERRGGRESKPSRRHTKGCARRPAGLRALSRRAQRLHPGTPRSAGHRRRLPEDVCSTIYGLEARGADEPSHGLHARRRRPGRRIAVILGHVGDGRVYLVRAGQVLSPDRGPHPPRRESRSGPAW